MIDNPQSWTPLLGNEGEELIKTYWDPDEGLSGVDEIWRGDKLVGIAMHMAL